MTSSSLCFSMSLLPNLPVGGADETTSWTRPQVQARADPNVLATTVWLNNLYNTSTSTTDSDVQDVLKDVKLSTPLVYADRFRIRHPGNKWNQHPPHIDGKRSFLT